MQDMLKKLAEKNKNKEPLPENYKNAKMGVLKDISDMASSSLGDDIKGLKKVSVMSGDRRGLEAGLDTAKKMIANPHNGQQMEDPNKHSGVGASDLDEGGPEKPETPSEEAAEPRVTGEDLIENQIEHEGDEGDLSPDDIDTLIAELQEQKAQKLAKK